MLIHLRKFSVKNLEGNLNTSTSLPELQFVGSPETIQRDSPRVLAPINSTSNNSLFEGPSGSGFRISEDVESIAGSSTHPDSEDIQVIPR